MLWLWQPSISPTIYKNTCRFWKTIKSILENCESQNNMYVTQFLYSLIYLITRMFLNKNASNEEEFALPDTSMFLKATIIKTAWHQHRSVDWPQWIRKESTGTVPIGHTNIVYDKDDTSSRWGKKNAGTIVSYLAINWANMNSRWYKKLKVKTETINSKRKHSHGVKESF